jgi:serine/threonine protein kinase
MTIEQQVAEGGAVLSPGETLVSGYRVVEHLHRSRDYDVYDVWSAERACSCVAKVVRPDQMQDPQRRRALLREGQLLLGLTHPHIVRAYQVIAQPNPVLVLETLTGETVAAIIESGQRLPLDEVAFLGLHLCSAMHYLHRQGVLHLDLKPDNIVSACGLAKVIDFSLARPPGQAGKGRGTPLYMAPEQVRGEALSEATDVWGIGAVLYEALTGRPPFPLTELEDEDGPERFPQVEGRAEALRVHRRVPAALAKAIDGCLEPDLAQRPSLEELARTLNAWT